MGTDELYDKIINFLNDLMNEGYNEDEVADMLSLILEEREIERNRKRYGGLK